MINAEFDQFDMIYSNSTESRQKICIERWAHFFAFDYVLESLQRLRLYVNNKKIIHNEVKRVFEANWALLSS